MTSHLLDMHALTTSRSIGGIFASEGYIPQLNEPGWVALEGGGAKIIGKSRTEANALARRYYFNDPMAQQAVRLHNAYTFGSGVSFRAEDENIQEVLSAFWEDHANRDVLSTAKAQWDLNTARMLDGEIFFLFYTSKLTGRVIIRTVAVEEIKNIVCSSMDARLQTHYLRRWSPMTYDFKNDKYKKGDEQKTYIPDWRIVQSPEDIARYENMVDDSNTELAIMHFMTNPFGGRGLSHIAAAIPWIKALKGFLEDRITLNAALSIFAWKQKIKGNAAAVARMRAQWDGYESSDSKYGELGDWKERRAGSGVLVENEASNLEQLKTNSGAVNAYQDARLLRQMVGISAGIFEHYIAGDAATGNLATAKAMELPMLKLFEFQQQVWEGAIRNIFEYVVVQAIRYGRKAAIGTVKSDKATGTNVHQLTYATGTDKAVSISFPPIVKRDAPALLNAVSAIKAAEAATGTEIIPPEQTSETVLGLLDMSDVAPEVIASMTERGFKPLNEAPSTSSMQRQSATEDIGAPLADDDAVAVDDVSPKEIEDMLADWLAMEN